MQYQVMNFSIKIGITESNGDAKIKIFFKKVFDCILKLYTVNRFGGIKDRQ